MKLAFGSYSHVPIAAHYADRIPDVYSCRGIRSSSEMSVLCDYETTTRSTEYVINFKVREVSRVLWQIKRLNIEEGSHLLVCCLWRFDCTQSPPSCMSRSLLIPESKEDHQWRLGGMLSMVTGKDQPSPSAAGESNTTQAQVYCCIFIHGFREVRLNLARTTKTPSTKKFKRVAHVAHGPS